MDREIKAYRRDLNRLYDDIEERYLLYEIDKKEYNHLIEEADSFEEQIDELEYNRNNLKKLKREKRKLNYQKFMKKLKEIFITK